MERIDKNRTTFDCGVMAKFQQQSRTSASDTNICISDIEYFGLIQDILKIDFRSTFHVFIFDVQWFKVIMEGQGATIRRDISGFVEVDSTKLWTDLRDTFVLPQHCEQVHEYIFIILIN